MTIAVVILAGGEGRRMGGDKPLKLLGGKTLLERVTTHARQWSETVAIAVRDQGQLRAFEARCIADDPRVPGPLGGVSAGLRFASGCGCEAVLTVPADMPFLPPDLAQRLLFALGTRQAAIACSGGHLHPVCGLWRAGIAGDIPAYVQSGKASLKGFAERVGFVAVEWPSDPVDRFFNVNNPGDLALAEQLLGA